MKIQFAQATEDLVSFYVFSGWLTPEKKTFRLQKRVFWGILALSPVLLILVNNEPEEISYLGVLVTGSILFTVGFMLAGKVTIQYYTGLVKRLLDQKMNADLLGLVELDFQDEKIIWKGVMQEGVSDYRIIKKIAQDDRYFYLYHNTLTAWVVPKTAFNSKDSQTEFENLIRRKTNV